MNTIIMNTQIYHRKLSVKIIRENYLRKLSLVYQWHRKVEIYRDTGVSKKTRWNILKKERHREGGKDKRERERVSERERVRERERGERCTE